MKQSNNQTNRVIKIDNVIQTKTTKQKVIGLLNTSQPKPLYLQTRFGIHTFGMKYPIDVLVMDNTFIVRKMMPNLQPQQIFIWNPRWQHVLELPEGMITKNRIKIGDIVSFWT